ncbi:MAG: hypothetical protein ACRDO1_03605 [Nocardioidaceae bacterium]
MRNPWAWRLAALSGLLYPVLLIVGDDLIARGDEVASDAGTPDEVAAVLAEKAGAAFFVGRSLGMISLLCLLVFVALVATRLRQLRGTTSVLPYLALGAGGVVVALQLSSAVFQIELVRHGGAGLDPGLVVLLLDFGRGFLVAMLPMALLLATVAVEGYAGRLVGRAVGWCAGALSIALVVGFVVLVAGVPLGFLPMPLTWVWFVAAGVSVMRRVPGEPDALAEDQRRLTRTTS